MSGTEGAPAAPKKRGRPPKNAVQPVSEISEAPAPKKQGRPPKNKSEPSPTEGTTEQSNGKKDKQTGKRGKRKTPTKYSTVQVPLKNVIRRTRVNEVESKKTDLLLDEMELVVKRANIFTMRAYELLKYFIITQFKNTGTITYPSLEICKYALSLCSGIAKSPKDYQSEEAQASKIIKEQLQEFYYVHFEYMIDKPFTEKDCNGYSLICEKTGEMMETTYKNNITAHYPSYLKKYLMMTLLTTYTWKASSTAVRKARTALRKKEKKNILALLDCLLTKQRPENLDEQYLVEYDECIAKYVPPHQFEENCVSYDIKINYKNYLLYMIHLSEFFEDNDVKMFQPCPLRHTEIPRFVTFQEKFFLTRLGKEFFSDFDEINKNWNDDNKYFQEWGDYLFWGQILRLNSKVFQQKYRAGYTFYNTFQTDFITCSLIFVKYTGTKEDTGKKARLDDDKERRVTNLSDEDKQDLSTRKLIGLDPGKDNVGFLIDANGTTLRYTNKQRRQEGRISKNEKLRNKLFRENEIKKIEEPLNYCNSKSVDPDVFREYIKTKIEIGELLREFYQIDTFRRMRLRSSIYKKKSLAKFLNRIVDTYGMETGPVQKNSEGKQVKPQRKDGSNIVIGYGDWSRTSQMAGCKPSLNIGFRKELQKRFRVVLVHEAYTSKICNECHTETENIRIKGKRIHRLLKCGGCYKHNAENKVCPKITNRDVNGSKNILEILTSELLGNGRPSHL